MSLPSRDAVPDAEKWDPTIVYASPVDWDAAADVFAERLDDLREYEGRAVEDGETLLETLDLVEELRTVRLGSIHLYAFLTRYVDTTDEAARRRMARYRELRADLESAVGFLEPELRRAGRDRVEALVASTPGLATHEAHLRRLLAGADHALSHETESALATLHPTFEAGSHVGREIAQGDLTPPSVETPDGEEATVTPQAKSRFLRSRDRSFRRTVHERFREALTDHRHGMAAAYVERIRADCRLAEVRGYDSALAMRLSGGSGGLRGSFPVAAYETVVNGMADELEPHDRLHRLRRDALGVDILREWDLHVPLRSGDPPEVPYDDAVDLILASVEPLGDAYVNRVSTLLDQRRVDVRQTANKRRGPKAIHASSVEDGPFLALNYDGGLRALYLFTHELGHAMNRELAGDAQRPVDQGVPVHTGEVASFLHEVLLVDHLVDVWEDDAALHAQSAFLDKLPLYRAARGAEFVRDLHEAVTDGDDPGPDVLDERHLDAVSRFNETVSFGNDAGAGWQEIDLTREPFHAYLYAVGAVGALSMAEALRDGTLDHDDYREMLARGRSVPSNEAFAPVLDFTDDATVKRGIAAYSHRVDRLAEQLGSA